MTLGFSRNVTYFSHHSLLSAHFLWGVRKPSREVAPHQADRGFSLPGAGPALALLRRLLVVLRQPLAADVLHHRVPGFLCGLQDFLHQRAGPARLQLHRLKVGRSQFTAQQVGFDLHTERWRSCSRFLVWTPKSDWCSFWGFHGADICQLPKNC